MKTASAKRRRRRAGRARRRPPPSKRRCAEPPAKRRARLRPLLALAPYVARYRGRALLALIALTVAAITTLVVPVAVRRMIDFGFTPEGIALINSYFSVMIAVVAVLAAASASRYYLVMTIGERIVADLRRDVFAHLMSLSPAFFDSARRGELISRLTADTTQIKSAVGASVSIALRNLMLFIGATAMMVITSPRLSGFVLLAIPLIVLPLVAFGRWVRRLSRNAQDTLADATAYASELVGAIRTVQAYTSERLANARFGGEVEQAYEAARTSTRARAVLTAIIIFIVFTSVVVILWIGSHDVLTGAITPGPARPVRAVRGVRRGRRSASSARSGARSRRPPAPPNGCSRFCASSRRSRRRLRRARLPVPARGDVSFDNVSFAYPTRPDALCGRRRVVRRCAPARRSRSSAPRAPARARCFICCCGSTIRLSGTISFDGVPIRAADPRELRARIALVPQESVVFAASARENIRFGRPDATDAEVERAADLAHATEFIRRLPGGFETQLGERGVTLSGGQRQRIAIARAILRDAPLLLLDEATSSLDAESETLVQTALEELMRHRTTLVIAHRLATVLSCDRIMVMEQGRIVEQGTHASLVAANGLYARLARLQFEGV